MILQLVLAVLRTINAAGLNLTLMPAGSGITTWFCQQAGETTRV